MKPTFQGRETNNKQDYSPQPNFQGSTKNILSQNKIIRIWVGKISLRKYFRVEFLLRLELFFKSLDSGGFFFLLFGAREATGDENKCKI